MNHLKGIIYNSQGMETTCVHQQMNRPGKRDQCTWKDISEKSPILKIIILLNSP